MSSEQANAARLIQAHFKSYSMRNAVRLLIRSNKKKHGLRAHARRCGRSGPLLLRSAAYHFLSRRGKKKSVLSPSFKKASQAIRMSRKIKDDHARVTLQRKKEMKRIAEHQLSGEIATTLQDESELSELDYRKQGNLDAYTTEAINMRRRLRADTDVGNRINRWWCHFNRPAGRLFFEVDAYVYMHIVLDHAVNGNEFATDEELIADAAVDWLEDAESKTAIVYDVFFNAIYELADLWTHSVEKVEYIEFLERALDDCRKMEESCTDAMRRRMQQLAKATKDRVIAEEFGELSWIRNFAKIGGDLYVDEYGQRLRRSEKHYMCNVVDGVALYDNHGRPLFDSLGRPIHYVDSTGMSKAFLTDDCGALYNAKGYKVDANGVKAKKAKKMGGSWSISKDVCPRSRSRKDLLTLGFHVGEDGELYRHDGSDPVGLTVGDDGKMRDAFGRVVVKGADGRWYDENGNLLYDENGNSHHFDGVRMGADGKMRDASGRVLVRGADGRWYDENGNLLYGENGNPINDKTTRGSKHRAAHRGMHHQSKVANARTRKDGMDSLPAIENDDLISVSQWDLSIRDVTMTSKLQWLGRKFSGQKQARIRKILRKDVPERTRDLPEKSANQHIVVPPLTSLPQIADASRAAANDAGAAAPSLPMSSRMEDFSMHSLPPIGAPALSARFSTKPRAGGWSKIRERKRIASAMVRGKSNNDVGANAPPPPSFEVGAAGSGFTWREKGGVQVAHEPPAAPTIGSFHASPSLRAGILETSARAVRILQHSDLNLGLSY